MDESFHALLSDWESFYVIVGSSSAALIGLQFVVLTVNADLRRRASLETIGAFATPTVVYFATAVLLSGLMTAPWTSVWPATAALALCGTSGIAYCAVVHARARRQTRYEPVWEDWIFYSVLPVTAFTAIVIAALCLALTDNDRAALFVVGAAAFGMLFIGIHNAWDAVTYILFAEEDDTPEDATMS